MLISAFFRDRAGEKRRSGEQRRRGIKNIVEKEDL